MMVGWLRKGRASRLASSTSSEVDAAAERLADRTFSAWSQRIVKLGIQAPTPVPVACSWAEADDGHALEMLNSSADLPTDPTPLASTASEAPRP